MACKLLLLNRLDPLNWLAGLINIAVEHGVWVIKSIVYFDIRLILGLVYVSVYAGVLEPIAAVLSAAREHSATFIGFVYLSAIVLLKLFIDVGFFNPPPSTTTANG